MKHNGHNQERRDEPASTAYSFIVPEVFLHYVDETILALSYRHGESRFSRSGSTLNYISSEDLSSEISYALIRAKIRADGHEQRAALFRSVFG